MWSIMHISGTIVTALPFPCIFTLMIINFYFSIWDCSEGNEVSLFKIYTITEMPLTLHKLIISFTAMIH